MIDYPLLTDQQFEELERQLAAAEAEMAMQRGSTVRGPQIRNLEFKAMEYIRRLVEDRKKLVASHHVWERPETAPYNVYVLVLCQQNQVLLGTTWKLLGR